jgi:hypothetical protein
MNKKPIFARFFITLKAQFKVGLFKVIIINS